MYCPYSSAGEISLLKKVIINFYNHYTRIVASIYALDYLEIIYVTYLHTNGNVFLNDVFNIFLDYGFSHPKGNHE